MNLKLRTLYPVTFVLGFKKIGIFLPKFIFPGFFPENFFPLTFLHKFYNFYCKKKFIVYCKKLYIVYCKKEYIVYSKRSALYTARRSTLYTVRMFTLSTARGSTLYTPRRSILFAARGSTQCTAMQVGVHCILQEVVLSRSNGQPYFQWIYQYLYLVWILLSRLQP